MRRQIKQKNRCASHQKRSIVRPMLSVMAIQIALTAEELGKIVSAGIPSIGTRKAIYQLTVYFAKETVAFCMFLLAQPACGTPRQRIDALRCRCYTPGTTCVRYAEAKRPKKSRKHRLLGTTCVRYAEAKCSILVSVRSMDGTTCVRYAEAKGRLSAGLCCLCGHNLRAVRRGKEVKRK